MANVKTMREGGDFDRKVELVFDAVVWGRLRDEGKRMGKRGVSTVCRWVVEEYLGGRMVLVGEAGDVGVGNGKEVGSRAGLVMGGEEGRAAGSLEVREAEDKRSKREEAEARERALDRWVLEKLESPGFLDRLPDSMKASLIQGRLPKMGQSRGEMEERALGLIGALKGLADWEDVQGELVTLREECLRLEGELEVLEAEHRLVVEGMGGAGAGELVREFAKLAMGWRSMVREALVGREAAERCGMLRKDKLVEVWTEGARKVAGSAVGVELVEEDFKGVRVEVLEG